jgi:hypothetical protein
MLNEFELTGRARTHVAQFVEPRFAAMQEVGEAFLAMREGAKKAGMSTKVMTVTLAKRLVAQAEKGRPRRPSATDSFGRSLPRRS